MCKCTPEIRTPFCGKPGCEWPNGKPEGARASDTPKADAAEKCIEDDGVELLVVPADFARAQERRIGELESMLWRCDMWLSTTPGGDKMQKPIRELLGK